MVSSTVCHVLYNNTCRHVCISSFKLISNSTIHCNYVTILYHFRDISISTVQRSLMISGGFRGYAGYSAAYPIDWTAFLTFYCRIRIFGHRLIPSSFSTLKWLKTYLRSSMRDERLTSLALIHVHAQTTPVEPVEVVVTGPHNLNFLR